MDFNLQHHNLLGNQILPKSEDFCILAIILDSKCPPISTVVCGRFWGVEHIQNGGHCHGNQGAKNVIVQRIHLKLDTKIDHHSKLCSLILIFLAYLVPLDVDVVPINFHQFLFGE
jgi:hypothetical protein